MSKIKTENRNINKMQRYKNNKKIIINLSVLLLIYFFTVIAVCLLIFMAELPQASIYYIVLISMAVASFFGGFISGKIFMKNGLINGLLYNLPFILLFIVTSLIFNGFEFDYKAVITLSAMLLSSAAGGILSVNSTRKKR